MREALGEAGLKVGRIETGVRDIRADSPRLKGLNPRLAQRMIRRGGELLIAVEQPGGNWLVLTSPWPRADMEMIWRTIAQTLILYGIVLLPVLWIGRRISRPLRSLALAARSFTPGQVDTPIAEGGPQDLRDVVSAFNALRLRVTAMLDEKDRMLGAIGHDLRTPLAALRVRIESVEDDADRNKMADTIMEMDRIPARAEYTRRGWQNLVVEYQAARFEGEKKISNVKLIKAIMNDQVNQCRE